MSKRPAIDWDTKLKKFPGDSHKEKIETLRETHSWIQIGKILGVQGQAVSKHYSRGLEPIIRQEVHHVRNVRRVNYLKELKAEMATPQGDKIREYNNALQLRNESPG